MQINEAIWGTFPYSALSRTWSKQCGSPIVCD